MHEVELRWALRSFYPAETSSGVFPKPAWVLQYRQTLPPPDEHEWGPWVDVPYVTEEKTSGEL